MKELIKTMLLDIRVQMEKIESTDTMAFTKVEWKVLQGKREVLAEVLANSK